MFVKNKNDKDYTNTVKEVYKLLSAQFGYTARISNFWELLKNSLGIKEFEIFDPRLSNNGSFEAYLIDKQIDWQNGEDVDFSEIYDAILVTGTFSGTEKLLFSSSNLEERLWAIYLVICDPYMNELLNF